MEVILIVIPAFIIFGLGYIGQKTIGFDHRSLASASLYLMYPFLAFQTFYENDVTLEYLYIVVFCVALMVILIGGSMLLAKLRNQPRSMSSAYILAGVFMNSGNYGVPIILFAFGEAGVDYAIIMMVVQSLLMNTVGLYYAARGSKTTTLSMKDSLVKIAKMPINHAVVIGLLVQFLDVRMPDFIMQAVDLIAAATIPTIMIALGMQLATLKKGHVKNSDLAGIFTLRFVVSPLVALVLTLVLGLDPMLSSILIVLAAMPTAANTTMYALQFNTEPELVSYSTLVTTVVSIGTVPLMLWLVGAVA
ncbi:AEC family transporter [Thalassobacillus hwangdonensis]